MGRVQYEKTKGSFVATQPSFQLAGATQGRQGCAPHSRCANETGRTMTRF